MSRNIVITSGKGGVGKSSVAAYLGAQLCAVNKTVLLIDMDEGLRSLDLMLNITSGSVFDVADVLCGRCELTDAVVPVAKCPGMSLLPAPAFKGTIGSVGALKTVTQQLSDTFDFIFIDCPAGIGDGFYQCITAADEALLVVNPDPVSVRDGATVSRILRKNGLSAIRLVINKINTKLMKKGIFPNIDEIIDETETQLIAAIPTDYEVVKAAATSEMLPDSFARDAFRRLAGRICGARYPLPKLEKFT